MVPGDGKRVCILIGGGPQTGDTLWQIEGVAYPVIVGPASYLPSTPEPKIIGPEPAPRKLSWKAQQKQLPRFLK